MMTSRILPIALVLIVSLVACGPSHDPVEDGQQTYSFRSDPDSEFISLSHHGGMLGRSNRLVVQSDGRLTYSVGQGKQMKISRTQLSEGEMGDLLELIVESGLMNHDHKRAKIGEFRDPAERRRAGNCSDCSIPSFTIQLSEDDCPGRGKRAPITVSVEAATWAAEYLPDVPELQASAELSRKLSKYRKSGTTSSSK